MGERDIKINHIDTLGDPREEWVYVTAIFTQDEIFYAGSKDHGNPRDYVPHLVIQDRSGQPEESVLGGVVLKIQQEITVDDNSHTFPNKISRDESNEYIQALIEKLQHEGKDQSI